MDHIQEIKERLNIEEVIGSYLQLKKAGRNFKAPCPFHNEKTGSFVVSPQKQIAHCFGCHWGGDVIKFVQDFESLSFVDALKQLAKRAGVTLPQTRDGGNKQEKDILIELHKEAADFFADELLHNKAALEYLKNRNISQETIKEFQLGWTPHDYHTTHTHLEKLGYGKKNLVLAGLASKKHMADEAVFDRFRGRIMFPICDNTGTIIAFGGRTLNNQKDTVKYLNSPDTPIYNKSKHVYGFSRAKETIRHTKLAIVTEGYFDVISCHQNGFKNVVASLGTALTEPQLKTLKRFADEIIFSFDSDTAGQNAASRSIIVAKQMDCNVKILEMPKGKDPDECVRENPKCFEEAINNRLDFMDYIIKKACEENNKNTVDGKKKIVETVLNNIIFVPNAIEREHYIHETGHQTGIGVKTLYEEIRKKPDGINRKTTQNQESDTKHQENPKNSTENVILSLMAGDMRLYTKFLNELSEDLFADPFQKSLYKKLASQYNPTDTAWNFTQEELKILSLKGEEFSIGFSETDKEKECRFLIKRLVEKRKKTRIQDLKKLPLTPESLRELNRLLKE